MLNFSYTVSLGDARFKTICRCKYYTIFCIINSIFSLAAYINLRPIVCKKNFASWTLNICVRSPNNSKEQLTKQNGRHRTKWPP